MARDRHTGWTNMAPYSCFHATTDYSKIKAGDELLAINGLSFVKWFKQNQFKSGGGANDFGGQRTALDYLTTIYGKFNRLPSKDSITFQFKSRANPQNSYTVTVRMSLDATRTVGSLEANCTRACLVKFFLEHLYDVRSLLVNELKNTKSVIYDLRGNPGGDAKFADSMVQLFKPDFEPFGDRYLMNKITHSLVADGKNPDKPISGFSLEVEAAGIEEFTVFQADGKTVAAKQRSRATTKRRKFAIPVSTVGSARSGKAISPLLARLQGKQVLKTKRNVRIIPTDNKYMKISTSGFTFSGLSDSVGLYQSSTTAPADGWNNLKGKWMIGTGCQIC
ncbi:hypothetical protein BASA83_009490 [Batrachochytrium salamandrivorans]|nr:hypothetical protein BASA83_009490 [Batrachochytrium salamandrivorans]